MKIIGSRFPLFFVLIMAVMMLLSVASAGADYTILHNFGASGDGYRPTSGPILSGSTLYGMTRRGGSYDYGTLFKMNTDGTDYTILHNFGASGDGYGPYSSPIVSGYTLYGTTVQGGSYDSGTLFKMDTDGTGYTILHNFGASGDGWQPFSSPILSGSTLYGMTRGGGSYGVGAGTLFKMNTDGTGYTILHDFGASGDGRVQYGSLLLSGSTLYGMTHLGGNYGYGILFKMNTDGTEYTILHNFFGGDGRNPMDSLILSGSTLYGMTTQGGSYDYGTLFKMNTDGTGYTILHDFSASGDGADPMGGLLLSGSTLYGMTAFGGGNDSGTLFKMNTDGTGYTILYNFGSFSGDGDRPYGSLILSGSTLYGMTEKGGSYGEFNGTVFSYTPSQDCQSAPVITSLSGPGPLALGSEAVVTVNFSNDDAGQGHTVQFAWGGGSADTVVDVLPDQPKIATGRNTYTATGVYPVTVTVTAACGASVSQRLEFVVIYDPEGGFVTGGGWIQSPLGAYTTNPDLSGRANFGFVSKYKKGANIPTGQTEFQFQTGSFNFHSTVYEWLVVAGAKAQYKGSGKVNGSGDYGFLLTVTDGQISGGGGVDRFRIKVWDKATSGVVYDNQIGDADDEGAKQGIAGGSIIIHK